MTKDLEGAFKRSFELDPFQREALEAIARGDSVIVAAPTGSGKTLIAEFAIERALAEGRRVIYTAPIKALSNQKFRDFSASWGKAVGIMTGDVTVNPSAPALIMTTEIFRNTIFDSAERLEDVACVIFDEVHFMDDSERGTVWEESIIFAPTQVRVVALSATVSNLDDMAGWMRHVRGHEVHVVRSVHRPVPLHYNLFSPDLGVKPLAEGLSALERRRRRRDSPGRSYKPRESVRAWYRRANSELMEQIRQRGQLPCIFFAFGRALCEEMAERCSERTLLAANEVRIMSERVDALVEEFDVGSDPGSQKLVRCLKHGVAWHHAGLLPTLKEVVERLFSTGLIKALFATETFALGVNMPARAVAFEGMRKWNGTARVPLRTRELQQMAGRAGRRGIDTEGHVFACVNPRLDTPDSLKSVFQGVVEPVRSQFNLSYSTLLHLYDRLGENIYEACERSFLAWQLRHPKKRAGGASRGRGQASSSQRFDRQEGEAGERLIHDRDVRQLNKAEVRSRKAHGGRWDRRRSRFKGGGRGPDRGHGQAPPAPTRPMRVGDLVDQVRRRLGVLEALGYKIGEELTAKGRYAARVYGYELQASELLHQGVMDRLEPLGLCVLASAVVHESRHDAWYARPSDDPAMRAMRREARRAIRQIQRYERRSRIVEPVRRLDWNLAAATTAWAEGAEFSMLGDYADVSDGDLCRSLRLVIQVLRQVRKPLLEYTELEDKERLYDRLGDAIALVKRDVVDAEWQVQLGEKVDVADEAEVDSEPSDEPEVAE